MNKYNKKPIKNPILKKCWELIVNHIKDPPSDFLDPEWFLIEERLKNNEHSAELMDALVQLIKPRINISQRVFLDSTEFKKKFNQPADLVSIKFESDKFITTTDAFLTWSNLNSPNDDVEFLHRLTRVLEDSLQQALYAGLEFSDEFGYSDLTVVSIAKHEQDTLREGFYPITRVIADVWKHLVNKDPTRAMKFIETWSQSSFRLIRRLAIFASSDKRSKIEYAYKLLATIPKDELFLASSSVEVYRLIKTRWEELSEQQKGAIEKRLIAGPRSISFSQDAKIHVDRCKYDILGFMNQAGLTLSPKVVKLIKSLNAKYPHWQLPSLEQAGFHFWTSQNENGSADSTDLNSIPVQEVIETVLNIEKKHRFLGLDKWQYYCKTNPTRAIKSLIHQAKLKSWPIDLWSKFLWSAQEGQNINTVIEIIQVLDKCPNKVFKVLLEKISYWLLGSVQYFPTENKLWDIFDRILENAPNNSMKTQEADLTFKSVNSTSGYLTRILIVGLIENTYNKKFGQRKILKRLNCLIKLPGKFGLLARVRMSLDLLLFYSLEQKWTIKNLIPLFDWKNSEAIQIWQTQKHINYNLPAGLFLLVKDNFIELFQQKNLDSETRNIFVRKLIKLVIADKKHDLDSSISESEVNKLIRLNSPNCLSAVSSEFADELKNSPQGKKSTVWNQVIQPLFLAIWPRDYDLQSVSANDSLVQMVIESGNSFQAAAKFIAPFLRPAKLESVLTIHRLSKLDPIHYKNSPVEILDILANLISDDSYSHQYVSLRNILDQILISNPKISGVKKFQRLLKISNNPLHVSLN